MNGGNWKDEPASMLPSIRRLIANGVRTWLYRRGHKSLQNFLNANLHKSQDESENYSVAVATLIRSARLLRHSTHWTFLDFPSRHLGGHGTATLKRYNALRCTLLINIHILPSHTTSCPKIGTRIRKLLLYDLSNIYIL